MFNCFKKPTVVNFPKKIPPIKIVKCSWDTVD